MYGKPPYFCTMNLSASDRRNIWHPFTQEKDNRDNIIISRGEGTWLYDENGKKYIDAISSWWVNIHGHARPEIATAIGEQAGKLEQVIFAGYSHEPAIRLASDLLPFIPGNPDKIFFSDNGSTSVEVALKMAIQYFFNTGKPRKKILAFTNAYHGDTFGAMSAGGKTLFNIPFADHLFEVDHLPVPVAGMEDECRKKFMQITGKNEYAAFIFEPLVQGSAGMVMYNKEVLNDLMRECRDEGMILIADEVFTGFGRTGTFFACDQLEEKPDIVCLSKGLTGGFLPMGITACKKFIYDAFYSDDRSRTFFHGHSYTANPLACAAANASLKLMNEHTFSSIKRISERNKQALPVFQKYSSCENARSLGTILALDYNANEKGYLSSARDEIIEYFTNEGILIRPLGNVIYMVPPYCISDAELDYIYSVIEKFLSKKNG